MPDFIELQKRMVEQQLKFRDIHDERVLAAFLKVPRHLFVEEKFQPDAYEDYPLPIGVGQTISQPYMVALMVQCLKLEGNEKILEIGTGSGFQTAILAELAKQVYSIERVVELAQKAESNLAQFKYDNINLKCGDGTKGWKEFSPYDGIIVGAGAPTAPQELVKQLNIGASLVIPLGGSFSQTLTVIKKTHEEITQEEICGCIFVPLIGEEGWSEK